MSGPRWSWAAAPPIPPAQLSARPTRRSFAPPGHHGVRVKGAITALGASGSGYVNLVAWTDKFLTVEAGNGEIQGMLIVPPGGSGTAFNVYDSTDGGGAPDEPAGRQHVPQTLFGGCERPRGERHPDRLLRGAVTSLERERQTALDGACAARRTHHRRAFGNELGLVECAERPPPRLSSSIRSRWPSARSRAVRPGPRSISSSRRRSI